VYFPERRSGIWASAAGVFLGLSAVGQARICRAGAFDFPLWYRLKDLCDSHGFSLKTLYSDGVLVRERPFEAVTFVDKECKFFRLLQIKENPT
jgi:alpha-amylase